MKFAKSFVGQTVVVSLSDDTAFRGRLREVSHDHLTLDRAQTMGEQKVDGLLLIPATSIMLVQVTD